MQKAGRETNRFNQEIVTRAYSMPKSTFIRCASRGMRLCGRVCWSQGWELNPGLVETSFATFFFL